MRNFNDVKKAVNLCVSLLELKELLDQIDGFIFSKELIMSHQNYLDLSIIVNNKGDLIRSQTFSKSNDLPGY